MPSVVSRDNAVHVVPSSETSGTTARPASAAPGETDERWTERVVPCPHVRTVEELARVSVAGAIPAGHTEIGADWIAGSPGVNAVRT